MEKDRAASIRQRLRDLARQRNEDFDFVLRQYVMQRLLYRLGTSEYANQFLLKGALLFWVWNNDFHRPTRDIDLLSFGNNDVKYLVSTFGQLLQVEKDDGLVFDIDSIKGIEIKEEADYSGVRLTGFVYLAKAKVPFQIDIGYGDVVIPEAKKSIIPSFLDLPSPSLHIYSVYSVLAEKFQAMVMLGMANSRMKDFYDIHIISKTMSLDGSLLSQAVKATFENRKTEVSSTSLYIFSTEFKCHADKQTQWLAFLNKNELMQKTENKFSGIIDELQLFLGPIHHAIAEKKSYSFYWSPEQLHWKDTSE